MPTLVETADINEAAVRVKYSITDIPAKIVLIRNQLDFINDCISNPLYLDYITELQQYIIDAQTALQNLHDRYNS